jgi:hypothetical protein
MNIIPFKHSGVDISEACWLQDKVSMTYMPYFTRKAIGEWLGARHPQKYVDNIIDRNPYINDYSVNLNLRCADGKKYDQNLLNPIGLQLVVMESDLPKAKDYKKAVARLIWEMSTGQFLVRLCMEMAFEPSQSPKERKTQETQEIQDELGKHQRDFLLRSS